MLLGSDGQHYQYLLPEVATNHVEPDEAWVIDPNAPAIEEIDG